MSRGRPLDGRRIVVTRGLDKTDRLPGLLENAGATVVKVPLIAPVTLLSEEQIRTAVTGFRQRAGSSRPWLVLSSETAVGMVAGAVGPAGLAGLAVAVVGPATAEALGSHGVEPDVVARGQEAESLGEDLARRGIEGIEVLVVIGAGGRNVVAPLLAARGARVEVVEAYRTVMPGGAAERLRAAFAGAAVDGVTFTSGSTVRNFAVALPDPPRRCVAVCIGPVTARAAGDAGWTSIVTAAEHTAAGVVAAAVECLSVAHPLP